MWTFTKKASFVTFFVQIKGALWRLPKADFEGLKILYVDLYKKSFICNIFCPNQGGSPLEASKRILLNYKLVLFSLCFACVLDHR